MNSVFEDAEKVRSALADYIDLGSEPTNQAMQLWLVVSENYCATWLTPGAPQEIRLMVFKSGAEITRLPPRRLPLRKYDIGRQVMAAKLFAGWLKHEEHKWENLGINA